MLGMGPAATGDAIDPDLTNAGKVPVTELPGAAYFHHADSFAMMRGGHLDVCVLGAYQVAANGDLANWHTGKPEDIPAVGGAMDLAIGAKDVYVMMTLFTKTGRGQAGPDVHVPAHRRRLCQPRLHRLRHLRHPARRRARPRHLRHHPRRPPRPGPGQAPRLTRHHAPAKSAASPRRPPSPVIPNDSGFLSHRRPPRQRGVSRKARAPAIQARCRSSGLGLPAASNPTLLKFAKALLSRVIVAYAATTSASPE